MFRFPAIRSVAFCLAIAFIPAVAPAQTTLKIGVINVQKALAETNELKKASADMANKYQPRQAAIDQLQKDLESIDAQLNGGKLTQSQTDDIQTEGTRKQRDLQRMQDDMQADEEKDRQDILGKMSQKMQDVIDKLAADKGMDLIVEASQTLFYKPALDLTADATAAYNLANPVK